ncbi:MAG: agmatine deiminase family protein [Planctomycetota bacterium]|jgi:hypothetical protein
MAVEAAPTYRDLFDAIPAGESLLVGVEREHDAHAFWRALGFPRRADPRVRFIVTGHPVSGWARDRYIVFERRGRQCIVLRPQDEVAGRWNGDVAIARALKARNQNMTVLETELALEGGNVIVADERVLVGVGDVLFNAERLQTDEADICRRLEHLFDRRVVVVGAADGMLADEHIDMFLSAASNETLLLGNPRLAFGVLDAPELEALGEFPPSLQRAYRREYEGIARHLRREGFRVRRLPILHAASGVIVTWNNSVVADAGGHLRAYVPWYGLGELERRAHRTWRRQGLAVSPIAADTVIGLGGAVRCITNMVMEERNE